MTIAMIQIIGGVIIGVGLVLFIISQWSGGRHSTSDAGLKAWSINITGPPGLILIVLGVAVMIYPISPWWSVDEPTVPPVTTTQTTATTSTTTTEYIEDVWTWPDPPLGAELVLAGEYCSTTPAVEWWPGDDTHLGWYIYIEAIDPESLEIVFQAEWDSQIDLWVAGHDELDRGWPIWCMWDGYDTWLDYDIWISGYNEYGMGDPILFTVWGEAYG